MARIFDAAIVVSGTRAPVHAEKNESQGTKPVQPQLRHDGLEIVALHRGHAEMNGAIGAPRGSISTVSGSIMSGSPTKGGSVNDVGVLPRPSQVG